MVRELRRVGDASTGQGRVGTWLSVFDFLPFSAVFRTARWKVKIRDKETREPPHVTILRGRLAWRINLRTGKFMDDVPDPALIPEELLQEIRGAEAWQKLCEAWDQMYPANPVSSIE